MLDQLVAADMETGSKPELLDARAADLEARAAEREEAARPYTAAFFRQRAARLRAAADGLRHGRSAG
jgi:hypothetical protein